MKDSVWLSLPRPQVYKPLPKWLNSSRDLTPSLVSVGTACIWCTDVHANNPSHRKTCLYIYLSGHHCPCRGMDSYKAQWPLPLSLLHMIEDAKLWLSNHALLGEEMLNFVKNLLFSLFAMITWFLSSSLFKCSNYIYWFVLHWTNFSSLG